LKRKKITKSLKGKKLSFKKVLKFENITA